MHDPPLAGVGAVDDPLARQELPHFRRDAARRLAEDEDKEKQDQEEGEQSSADVDAACQYQHSHFVTSFV